MTPNPTTPSEIHSVCIGLEVDDEQSLFIMLAADGTIKRMGRGTIDNDETQLFSGTTDQHLFESLMATVDRKLFSYAGSYRDEAMEGQFCRLLVMFNSDEDSTSFEFKYGSESQGPPTEFCDLVVASIDLTDPWYEEQLFDAEV